MSKGKTPWVTASDVATAEICPYQLHLKQMGAKTSAESIQRAQYGNAKHDEFNTTHGSTIFGLIKRVALFVIFMLLAAIAAYLYWNLTR